MTETYTVPNTHQNHVKITQAVAQFMVEKVLSKEKIMEMAVEKLEQDYDDHYTIGELAALVKQTEIPKQHPDGPAQSNHILCFGTYHNEEPADVYYFFTKVQDYEYSALEVKEA